ncbi:hypothetical protein PoB_006412200 [Plakobranchus ocellatus]|uniref:Uncharacterized protein n=1 Tax=Plakobranchus ocellatus TaxID=259542 RepID=A0AAV4D0E7_9GAST|nr:hypothetical protein PoB_006412200 [Plakobranchus ocellatus]
MGQKLTLRSIQERFIRYSLVDGPMPRHELVTHGISPPYLAPCSKMSERHEDVLWGAGGTVASESALRSEWTLLSRVRAPPPPS